MNERVGRSTGARTNGEQNTWTVSSASDPVVRLSQSFSLVGKGLTESVVAGAPLSSAELGRVLDALPTMSAQTRLQLYETLRGAHQTIGSLAPPPSTEGKVTVGELLELMATPAVPRTYEAVALAKVKNDEALAQVKGALESERRPDQRRALEAQRDTLSGRAALLAQYASALSKPLLVKSDGWKVAADRVDYQLKHLDKQLKAGPGSIALRAYRDELVAAREQLLARSALENDPTHQLGEVPVLGDRLVELTRGDRLEASEVAKFLGTQTERGLADLSPPQRKALLRAFGEAMHEDLLPPKLLKLISRPVTTEHIIAALSSAERFPKTQEALTAALDTAKGKLAAARAGVEALAKGGAAEALPAAEQKKLAELKTQVAYGRARVDELTARLEQLEKGLPAVPVEPWPANVADAAGAVGRVQARLGERREQLFVEKNPATRARLGAEVKVLEAQKRTLELLHDELKQLPALSFWQKTGGIAAVNALALKVPGLFGLWGSAGVMRDPADRLTQKNELRPFAAGGVSTPLGGVGGMYSKTVKGFQGELNPIPMTAVGRNPMLGDFVGFCIPCVVAVTISSNGTLGITKYSQVLPVGGRLFVRNEKFAAVTQPVTEALIAGYDGVAKLLDPVRKPLEDATRPVLDAAKKTVADVQGLFKPGRAS